MNLLIDSVGGFVKNDEVYVWFSFLKTKNNSRGGKSVESEGKVW